MSFDFEDDLDQSYGMGVMEPAPSIKQEEQEQEPDEDMEKWAAMQQQQGQQGQAHESGTRPNGEAAVKAEPQPEAQGSNRPPEQAVPAAAAAAGGTRPQPEAAGAGRHLAGAKRPFEALSEPSAPPDQQQQRGASSVEGGAEAEQAEADLKPDEEEMATLVQEAKQSNCAVYVANLAWWTTDAEVEAACAEFGRVLHIKFIEDRFNGKSKGCVLVEFEAPEAAVACKENLQGRVINGKSAVLTFASGRGLSQAIAGQQPAGHHHRGGPGRQDGMGMGHRGNNQGGFMPGRGRGPRGGGRFGGGPGGGFPPMGMPGMGMAMGMGMGMPGMPGMGMPGMGMPGMGMPGMGMPGMPGMPGDFLGAGPVMM